MRLKETQKAYVAGLVDGDGNINIAGNYEYRKNTWVLSVCIYNCDLKALEIIRDWMDMGSIYSRKRDDNWQENHRLKFRAKSAASLLKKIYPYLIIKKKQAKIALEFAETFKKSNYTGCSFLDKPRRLKEETVQRRKYLKQKLQSLTGKANYLGKK